jgi:hypothetical protein
MPGHRWPGILAVCRCTICCAEIYAVAGIFPLHSRLSLYW